MDTADGASQVTLKETAKGQESRLAFFGDAVAVGDAGDVALVPAAGGRHQLQVGALQAHDFHRLLAQSLDVGVRIDLGEVAAGAMTHHGGGRKLDGLATELTHVFVDGHQQALEDVGNRTLHPLPARHERLIHGGVHEGLARTHDVLGKSLDRGLLGVAVVLEPVHGGVVVIALNQVKGRAIVGSLKSTEEGLAQDLTLSGQLAVEGLGDIHAHLGEPLGSVLGREVLMLMVVDVGNIHLTNALGRVVAPNLGNDAHLQTPIGRNADILQHLRGERKLTGKRIAETVEILEELTGPTDLLQRTDERRDQQTAHAAVELVVGNARVEALAEFVAEVRVGDGIDQPRKQISIVSQNIAIVQGHCLGATGSQSVTEAIPDVATLARFHRSEIVLLEHGIDSTKARTVVPQHAMALRQAAEVFERVTVLIFVGAIEADDDLIEVFDLGQLSDNVIEGRAFELGEQRWQHQTHGPLLAKLVELVFKTVQWAVTELVEGGYVSVLEKICHVEVLGGFGTTLSSPPLVEGLGPTVGAGLLGLQEKRGLNLHFRGFARTDPDRHISRAEHCFVIWAVAEGQNPGLCSTGLAKCVHH